jgi:hypothetical protein
MGPLKQCHVSYWPTAAVPLDGVSTAGIEGTSDQMGFREGSPLPHAVRAIDSRSQHNTMRAVGNRIARFGIGIEAQQVGSVANGFNAPVPTDHRCD